MARTATRQERRAPRVRLGGTILALVRLENGRQIRARVHQLSVTGGLLHLDTSLDEGIRVEVMFHVGDATVRTRGKMLFPMWATKGCMQPFAFVDMDEEHREKLEANLKKFLEKPHDSKRQPAITIEETPSDEVTESTK